MNYNVCKLPKSIVGKKLILLDVQIKVFHQILEVWGNFFPPTILLLALKKQTVTLQRGPWGRQGVAGNLSESTPADSQQENKHLGPTSVRDRTQPSSSEPDETKNPDSTLISVCYDLKAEDPETMSQKLQHNKFVQFQAAKSVVIWYPTGN